MSLAFPVDLQSLLQGATSSGPQWGAESEDLDMTLLSWAAGEGIATHVNDEVDVLVVALAGDAQVTVGDEVHQVASGQAILLPKSKAREIVAGPDGFAHLNVHQRRKRLMPKLGGGDFQRRIPPAGSGT